MIEEKPETKICAACKQELPITQFYFRSDNGVYRSSCKKCKRIRTKEEVAKQAVCETKVCKHCGVEKSRDEFNKSGKGKWCQPYCKPCDTIRKKKHTESNIDYIKEKRSRYYKENSCILIQKNKKRYENNKESILIKSKEYRIKNADRKKETDKNYRLKNRDKLIKYDKERYLKNKEEYSKKAKIYRDNRTPEQIYKNKEYNREYRIKNKERIKELDKLNIDKKREYRRNSQAKKLSTNTEYRILKNLRSRIRFALLKYDTCKSDTTKSLLGCDILTFRSYIESKFQSGMSWENYGRFGWHIDHIKACKHFNLSKPQEQRICFNYKNLQPLWWEDNLKKGTKDIY